MGLYKGLGKLFALGCTLSMLAVTLGACGEAVEDNVVIVDQSDSGIAYEFAMAEISDVIKTEKLTCTYRQTNEQEVCFTVSGKLIDKVYVKEGQNVTKGTLLAELSSEELERQIEDLEYSIKRNEILLSHIDTNENYDISGQWVNYLYYSAGNEEAEERLNNNIESIQRNYRYQREDCNDQLEADRKKLSLLQGDLKASRVYAETDGIVYKLKDDLEDSTSRKDEVIMRILDTSDCLFETKAPESAHLFHEGDIIQMSVISGSAAGQYELKPWHIEEWGETQLFEVIDGPENNGIDVGTSGSLVIESEKRSNVISVPKDAVHTADNKYFVYVLGSDNMREVRWVETGLMGNERVEIKSGLTEGEKVIRK